MPIGRPNSDKPMKVAVHVVNSDGPVGEFMADPDKLRVRNGEGWVSFTACDDLRALLGSSYMYIPFSMVIDGKILNPCRMLRDNPISMRFVYSMVPATNPTVDPALL